MKRLFRIFELSKNEQRVVLIVMFVLIVFAFVGYERRVIIAFNLRISPSPADQDRKTLRAEILVPNSSEAQ